MAFLDLTTCRELGAAMGPINWLTLQRYAEVYEVTGEQREDLFYHVQLLDKAYLEWHAAKRKKEEESKKSPHGRKPRKR